MAFIPTDEQNHIINLVKTTRSNILIEALAGAAKTSTLILIAQALPGVPTLALAFNKRIAEEMATRMPSWVICSTMHSIGYKAWQGQIRKRLALDSKKIYNLVKESVDMIPDQDEKEFMYENFADTMRLVSLAKNNGYIPDGILPSLKRIITDNDEWKEEIAEDFVDGIAPLQWEIIDYVMRRSIAQAFDGNIDFDDMIYMPTMFGGVWPQPQLVLVDEAQDLSPLNHYMLSKIVAGRIIAVGDPHQSIYGFRGASTDSMSKLEREFSMIRAELSISFRCPRRIVLMLRKHAPNMKWADNAREGTVEKLERWDTADIPDGSTILCRNNAPLFRLALQFLKTGRGVHVLGAEIGPGLIKILKKFGDGELPQEAVIKAIEAWKAEKLAKATNDRQVAIAEERAECLMVFANAGSKLSEAVAFAEHLFKSKGGLLFSSGHKAKGLEFDRVYHLDPWRIPSKYALGNIAAMEQERNLEYVIGSRTKDYFATMSMEGLFRE